MPKHIHLHLPKNVRDMAGALRTVARGSKVVHLATADRMPKVRKARDMGKADFAELESLLKKFFSAEAKEPEHAEDCNGKDDCGCGCKH